MTIRFLGLSDEERLAIEESTGVKTEGAQMIVDASVQAAQNLMNNALREIQEVIGPHGSVTRLQAGGVRISPSLGMSVFEDGVLKTTIEPDGDLLAGSDITQPSTTTFCVFVNEQTYNNETMGAGDLLIGDNSAGTSNVKYDASEGQLQFRYGTTVNVYMDTDGSLKAGGGEIFLDSTGASILIPETRTDLNSYKFVDAIAPTVPLVALYGYKPSASEITGELIVQDTTTSRLYVYAVGSSTGETQVYAQGGGAFAQIVLSASAGGSTIALNEIGTDVDVRIESNNDANNLFSDGGTDRIGIGTNAPAEKLDVVGNIKASGTITASGLGSTPNSGWTEITGTWTYASATTITIPSDGTTVYQKTMKIRLKQGGGYKYYVAQTVAATLITVMTNTDYTVANAAITDVAYSYAENPYGFPLEFNFTPSWTNLTTTSGTTTYAKYSIHANMVYGRVHFVFGASSSIGGTVDLATPVPEGTYAASASRPPVGLASYLDAGTAAYLGNVVFAGANTLRLQAVGASGTYANIAAISSTVPFVWGNTDELSLEFRYSL